MRLMSDMLRILPILVMILSAMASIAYFVDKDAARGVYWAATAVIYYVITFMLK